MPEAQWTDALLSGMPPAPPYFKRMKQVNAAGPAVLTSAKVAPRRVTATELKANLNEWIVLDARAKEAFAAAHVPGSISIANSPNLPTWAGWVVPYDRPIVIIAANASDASEVVTHLLRVGFDQIEGVLEGGIDEWVAAGFEATSVPTISVQRFHDLLAARGKRPPIHPGCPYRRRVEQRPHRGRNAHSARLVTERTRRVPKDRQVAITCGTGFRSTIASSLLLRNGYRNILNIVGGMTAWNAAKLPIVRSVIFSFAVPRERFMRTKRP